MTAVGIVAEYNPFHNGHLFHIEQTRARFPDCAVVCVMSGHFVQRGGVAVTHKNARAAVAVLCGADLVLELPAAFSCAPAEIFADRAVALLAATGVVGAMSFGSECGDIELLTRAADDASFDRDRFEALLRAGCSYAAARAGALAEGLRCAAEAPNDLLAVEYLRAVRRYLPEAALCAVRRQGAGHDRQELSGAFPSASRLRAMLRNGEAVGGFVPRPCAEMLERERAAGRGPVLEEALDLPVLAALRRMEPASLAALPEVAEGLEYRIAAEAPKASSAKELLDRLKTKRYTRARLRRILTSAYIGLTRAEQTLTPQYLRLLAVSQRGTRLLKEMQGRASLPVITKPAALKALGAPAEALYALEARADSLYALAYPAPETRGSGSLFQISPYVDETGWGNAPAKGCHIDNR